MLRIIAILVGIGFIFVGVAGFIPEMKQNGLLFGYFETSLMHHVFDLVAGVIAIMAATSVKTTKLYFQIFGIIFAVIAVIGFFNQGNLYILHVNVADIIFFAVAALIFLILGFMVPARRTI